MSWRPGLESTIGSGTAGAVTEETFWAVRRLVETLARDSPVVLVFEDIHWCEATLLDLIEHLADSVRDSPVLIMCLARPELLDDRPAWGGGKLNATSILLEPLSGEQWIELIGVLPSGSQLPEKPGSGHTGEQDGNPLFVEQMLAMLATEQKSASSIKVPPAIQALLAARLEHRLKEEERHVLERASVEGEVFHAGAVVDLSPPPSRAAGGVLVCSASSARSSFAPRPSRSRARRLFASATRLSAMRPTRGCRKTRG